jgi:hypothetical protein
MIPGTRATFHGMLGLIAPLAKRRLNSALESLVSLTSVLRTGGKCGQLAGFEELRLAETFVSR